MASMCSLSPMSAHHSYLHACLAGLIVLALALSCACSKGDAKSAIATAPSNASVARLPTAAEIASAPMHISFSVAGSPGNGSPWIFTVDPDGRAVLDIKDDRLLHPLRIESVVPLEKLGLLRDRLASERFFELDVEYGRAVADGTSRNLTVAIGDESRTVIVRTLEVSDPKLDEARRALRIWSTVQGWFESADAADLRPGDRRFLGGAAKAK